MKQREIKFRAWDGEKMLGQDRVGVANGRALVLDTSKSKDWPLMQYTGLKDRQGREIYEGDVLWRMAKDYKGVEHESIQLVGMGDWCNGVMEDNFTYTGPHVKGISGLGSSWYGHLTHNLADNCEVIGNIYENPELLKP